MVDAKTNETLIGAMVTLNGTDQKTVTNIDGKFKFDGLNASNKYTLVITYVI
ncbi:MAG: carboxypeptidase-like regulatory domain-containing protein [Massilibacteroides sp.]|nr:carboxypeptidase-like regulatory domain-containing protein [Massilibacteroides sp.]